MLDLAPPTDLVPPSAVDRVAPPIGRAFVDAIVIGDFDRLETLFAPDVRFRAIIPGEYLEVSTAADARALVRAGSAGRTNANWSAGRSSLLVTGSRSDTGSS